MAPAIHRGAERRSSRVHSPRLRSLLFTVLLASTGASAKPTVFWSSAGHTPSTTVLALGANLGGSEVVVCQSATGTGNCTKASVLHSAASSIHFLLPVFEASARLPPSAWFAACEGSVSPASCSSFRAVNSPDVWWAQGDQSRNRSAVVTAGGWLRVYGRALGFSLEGGGCTPANVTHPNPATSGTVATLSSGTVNTHPSTIVLRAVSASCYEATFDIPRSLVPGRYNLVVANGLKGAVCSSTHDGEALTVDVVPREPWPPTVFPVADGASIVEALAAADRHGGGVVTLGGGAWDLGNTSLRLGHNVQLVGVGGRPGASVLRWTRPTTQPLVANVNASTGSRYALRDLSIEVAAAASGYVLDIGGHGVRISGVSVSIPHSISAAASVVHTHGTGFSLTGCNMTHDQSTCTSPGYPRNCLMFFEGPTDNGLVANNSFQMGCCSFSGYSANGILLEDNVFLDLPWAVQPDGNGFSTFGPASTVGDRVSERLSFSRNTYQGMFNSRNVRDGTYPHEAFTSDGNGGAYAGPIQSSTLSSVTIPGKAADPAYIGGAMAVLAGPGQGQLSRVTAVRASTYTIHPPLDAALGHGTTVVIAPYVGKVLMMGNVVRNSTTVQIFGSGFDTVYAGNTLEHMYSDATVHPGGLSLMALDYQGGYQPNMHFEVVGNTVTDVTGGIGVMIDGNPDNMSLSHGHIVRGNTVTGHRSPPTEFSNIDGAITVGVDATSVTCGCRRQADGTCCFGSVKTAITSVVVEGNTVLMAASNGTCAANGIRVFAANTVVRGNVCREL